MPSDIYTLRDQFARIDAASLGSSWADAYGGAWSISGNRAVAGNIVVGGLSVKTPAVQNLKSANVIVSVTIGNLALAITGNHGVVYRYSDLNNYWAAYYNEDFLQIVLIKVVAGTTTTVKAVNYTRAADSLLFTAIVQGTRHVIQVAGVTVIDQTDSALSTATYVGMFGQGGSLCTFADWQAIVPFAQLPDVLVSWTEPSYPSSGTWAQYNVYRQLDTDTVPTRIAAITTHTTVLFRDTQCPPGVVVTYTITQAVWFGGSLIESTPTTAATVLTFKNIFLQDVDDPTEYVQFREASVNVTRVGDVVYQQVAGTPRPIALVGEKDSSTIAVTDVPHAFDDTLIRSALVDLWQNQVQSGKLYCLRSGYSNERFFVTFDAGPIFADSVQSYIPSAKFTEVDYSEAV